MEIEELKAGERYNFTLLYTGQSISKKFRFEAPTGMHYILGLGDLEAISPISAPENGRKNSEPAPKYDPNRLFRKGDRVQVKRRNGRCSGKYGEYLREAFCLVAEDEDKNELVRVFHNSSEYRLDPAYLELVTPVEELEPYKCGDGIDSQLIFINDELFAEFENEKDAARVCALLNAEHRKENSHE